MLQIALVSDEHDDDIRVCVVAELLQPPRDVGVRLVFRDVVHEQRANCAAVVRRRDRTVAFLTSCSPHRRVTVEERRWSGAETRAVQGRVRTGVPDLCKAVWRKSQIPSCWTQVLDMQNPLTPNQDTSSAPSCWIQVLDMQNPLAPNQDTGLAPNQWT